MILYLQFCDDLIAHQMQKSTLFTIVFLLASLIIGFAVSTLTWLHHLKKKDCTCAEDANYKYIMFMSYYVIVIGVFGLITAAGKLRGYNMPMSVMRVRQVIGIINLGLLIALIVVGFKYIKALKDRQCACALDDPRRKVFQAWMWMYIGLYTILFITLFVVIMLVTSLRR